MIRLVFVLALSLILGTAAEPLRAQATAVDVNGWERSAAATGTIYYRCRVATCAAGSTVSYRAQQAVRFGPLSAFRAHHEQVNQRMIAASQGRVSRVETLEVQEGETAGARSQTIVKMIEFADGRREAMATGIFSDGTRHISVVSTAPTGEAARANLAAFVPVAMLAVQAGGKPSDR